MNHNDAGLLEPVTYYTHTIRADHNVSDRQRIWARYSFYKRASNYNNYLGSIATGEWFKFMAKQAALDDVYTITPTLVLNVRYGYNRFIRTSQTNPGSVGMDLTTLGFSSQYNSLFSDAARRFPGIGMSGYFGTAHQDFWRPCDTHSPTAILTKQWGAHSVKGGMELRVYRENSTFYGNDAIGRFTFDGTWTKATNVASAPSPAMGHSVAALLLGLPTSGQASRLATYAEQSPTWGVFVQDDWRVGPKLTVNLGLRWEYEGPLTERYNRSVTGFDPNYVQPIQAAAQLAYAAAPLAELPASQFKVMGGDMFAGVGGQSRGLYQTSKKHFMPRVGFAYQLREKTVVRGGYGIFFGFLGQRRSDVVQDGFNAPTDYVPTNNGGLTFDNFLSNPFPSGMKDPVGAALGGQTFLAQNLNPFNPNPLAPYNQRWQLGFQHEFQGGFVADMAYVGNRGTHIEIYRNINTTPIQYLSTAVFRDQAAITKLSGNVSNPFKGLLPGTTLNGSTIARERLLQPYPEFGSITTTTNQGYTWYHSLQVSLQKRFSKGYTLMAAYTFSKFMQATEYLNAADPMPLETISDQDTPHRISVSGIWELPFGKGKPLGANLDPVLSRIIGGWQLQAMYVYQSAYPIDFSTANTVYVGGNVEDLRLQRSEQTPAHWFNTAGFVTASAQNIDTARQLRVFPRRFGFLRGDPLNNWDASILKNIAITEGKNIQFRFELINALNHPNFNNFPDVNPTSSTFGKVSSIQNYARRAQLTLKFVF
jgi:hypothetical protein